MQYRNDVEGMTESTIADRLQGFFTARGLSIAQVSRDTGIHYDTLQQILYGRVKAMGVDKFAAIWQTYPDLDARYVLTGSSSNQTKATLPVNPVEQIQRLQKEINRLFEEIVIELNNR